MCVEQMRKEHCRRCPCVPAGRPTAGSEQPPGITQLWEIVTSPRSRLLLSLVMVLPRQVDILPSPTLSVLADEARQASLKLREDDPCSSPRGRHMSD